MVGVDELIHLGSERRVVGGDAPHLGVLGLLMLVELIDLGPTFFRPVTKLTLWLLIWIHGFIPNYGWVIILLSVVTKFLFYPLTKSSTNSMRVRSVSFSMVKV